VGGEFPKSPLLRLRGDRPARRTNSLAGGGVMEDIFKHGS